MHDSVQMSALAVIRITTRDPNVVEQWGFHRIPVFTTVLYVARPAWAVLDMEKVLKSNISTKKTIKKMIKMTFLRTFSERGVVSGAMRYCGVLCGAVVQWGVVLH
jgi:hypothetical protein